MALNLEDYVPALKYGATISFTNENASSAIAITQTGNAGSDVTTDGAIHIQNTENTGIGLGVYSNIGAALAPLVKIHADNTAFDKEVLYVEGNGDIAQSQGVVHFKYSGVNPEDAGLLRLDVDSTGFTQALWIRTEAQATNTSSAVFMDTNHGGQGIYIQHSGGLTALRSKHFRTNVDTAGDIISHSFNRSVTVDDGSTYTSGGKLVEITNSVTETSGTITDTATMLDVEQANAGATGSVTKFTNAGTGATINVDPNGTTAANIGAVYISNSGNDRTGLYVYSNNSVSASGNGLVEIVNDHTSNPQPTLKIQQDGTSRGIFIDHNAANEAIHIDHDDTAADQSSFEIDRDGNNAGDVIGIEMNIANAGAGDAFAFKFTGSEVVNAAIGGSQDYKIRVSVAGTDYFIPLHTA